MMDVSMTVVEPSRAVPPATATETTGSTKRPITGPNRLAPLLRLATRQIYWLRFTLSIKGLPPEIALDGTFCRVELDSNEIGSKLSSRQIVTQVSHSQDPEFAGEVDPICFAVGDSTECPASSSALLVEVFASKRSANFLPCMAPLPPSAVPIAKVRVLLKDVLSGGKMIKKFVSPMALNLKNGETMPMGEMHAEVILSGPRKGRCVLGVSTGQQVFDHMGELCYLVDKRNGKSEGSSDSNDGFSICALLRSGRMGMQRSEGVVEARCDRRGDASVIQLLDLRTDTFNDWLTVSLEGSANKKGKRLQVTNVETPKLELLEPQSKEGKAVWGPGAVGRFAQKVTDMRSHEGKRGDSSPIYTFCNQWVLATASQPMAKKHKTSLKKTGLNPTDKAANHTIPEEPETESSHSAPGDTSTSNSTQQVQASPVKPHNTTGSIGLGRRLSRKISGVGEAFLSRAKTGLVSFKDLGGRATLVKQVHWTVADFKAMPFRDPAIPPGKKLMAKIFHGHVDQDESMLDTVWGQEANTSLNPSDAAEEGRESGEITSVSPSAAAYVKGSPGGCSVHSTASLTHFNSHFSTETKIAVAVEFEFEDQRLAPGILALALEMHRLNALTAAPPKARHAKLA